MAFQSWSPLTHAIMSTIVQRPVSVLTFATFEDMPKSEIAKSYSEIVCGKIDNFFVIILSHLVIVKKKP